MSSGGSSRLHCCSSEKGGTMWSSRGFALIVVLWFLVLIAAMSTYLIANARQETAIARNIIAAAAAEALADAGVAQTVFNQTDPVESRHWLLDGTPHVVHLADGEVTIRLTDERAKINPNRASDALLAALFEASGVERPRARRIGASIADWVDRDGEPHQSGAERDQYVSERRSYAPPNLPLENLDELQLVLGGTPEIYALVRPYLTLFGSTASPDPRAALPIVRAALRMTPQEVEPSAAAPAEDDPQQTADERAAAEEEQAEAAAEDADTHPIINIDVIARAAGGGVFVRHAVLRLDPAVPKGYVVLDWRRGDMPM